MHGVPQTDLDKKNFTINSTKLVYFDRMDNIKFFRDATLIFTSNVVLLGPQLDDFSTREQWTFQRNVFLTLALPYLKGNVACLLLYNSTTFDYFDRESRKV